MPRSPTIEETIKNLSKIKNVLQFEKAKDRYNLFYSILFLYPILTILALLYVKPLFILKPRYMNNDMNDTDKNNTLSDISYNRLIMWFIIFQLPFILYFLINTCK